MPLNFPRVLAISKKLDKQLKHVAKTARSGRISRLVRAPLEVEITHDASTNHEFRAIDLGEWADAFCRQNPNHRLAMTVRDMHTHIANAMAALSDETRKKIASA